MSERERERERETDRQRETEGEKEGDRDRERNREKHVTQGYNIVADRCTEASNPHPHPTPTYKHLDHLFFHFSTLRLMDQHTNRWTDRQASHRVLS